MAESMRPEAQKKQGVDSAQAKSLHWRLKRPHNRCVGLSAHGRDAGTSDDVGAMLIAHWPPIFTEREVGDSAMER